MSMRNPLKDYKEGEYNEMVFVVADTKDENHKPLFVKTQNDLDEFFGKLHALVEYYKMEVDMFGLKKAMVKRLLNTEEKDAKKLLKKLHKHHETTSKDTEPSKECTETWNEVKELIS